MRNSLPVFALIAACFSESGSGPASATATDETGTSTGSSGGAVEVEAGSATADATSEGEGCAPGDEVPPPTAGWDGPYLLIAGGASPAEPPSCPPDLTDAGVSNEGPLAPSCACSCVPGCNVSFSLGEQCSGATSPLILVGTCVDPETAGYVGGATVSPQPSGCAAPRAKPPELQWNQQLRSCAGVSSDTCVVGPPDAIGPCIRREGLAECPQPEQLRVVTHAGGLASCDACASCEPAQDDACESVVITGFAEARCGGAPSAPFDGGDCSPTAIRSFEFEVPAPACPPANGNIAELEVPVTYCCTP